MFMIYCDLASEASCPACNYDGFFYHRGAFGDPHDEENYFHLEPLDVENGSVSFLNTPI